MLVVVASADAAFSRLIKTALQGTAHEVLLALSTEAAWRYLSTEPQVHVAVLDGRGARVSGVDAHDLCERVRARGSPARPFLLLVVDAASADLAEELLGVGADDVAIDPVVPAMLRARLRLAERLWAAEDEVHRSIDKLPSAEDSLTGLLNRSAILLAMERDMARAARDGGHFSIILADVDGFRLLNDRYGTVVGDEVLREISSRFRALLRASDGAGRFGGEEFLFLLPDCPHAGARDRADRLRRALFGNPVVTRNGPLPVTCSFGVATFHASRLLEPDALLAEADAALINAKRAGKNRVI